MKKALGKGLNAILPSPAKSDGRQTVYDINIDKIEPNPNQPRKVFDEEALRQLADSISSVGIVQPIIVSDEGAFYRIIAGERRWRAAGLAGLGSVPAIIRTYPENQTVEIALIENLQRQDLNPIEEAEGYERLISEYGYTQEKIAKTVGRSRPAVANAIRLLKLSDRIRGLIAGHFLSSGHARALLAVESPDDREKLADEILTRDLNVRQTEALVSTGPAVKFSDAATADAATADATQADTALADTDTADTAQADSPSGDIVGGLSGSLTAKSDLFARTAALSKVEDALRNSFNTRVALSAKRSDGRGGGRIVIDYYSDEELERLLECWGINVWNS